jgi:serine/threonine protein kinase
MHEVGLAHLDVKPGNVILRPQRQNLAPRRPRAELRQVPVLVDFGLAGRKLRPGCGSPYYGAPEVWDTVAFGERLDPRAADVYAFACLAYEILTGKPLFAGATLPAIFTLHLTHDGGPPELDWLRTHERHAPLGQLLSAGLAREPGKRIGIKAMRARLQDIARTRLADATWPIRP